MQIIQRIFFFPLFFWLTYSQSILGAPKPSPLVWRGDLATARAFMIDIAKQYEAQKQGKIVLQPFSTISGLDAVSANTADIAGSARPAMPKRIEESSLKFYPIALDAIVPITSPKNPVSKLGLKQLHDIYLGKLTNWKEIGGEDKPINVYAVAGPLDGIEYSTRLLLYKNGDQRVAAPRLYVNTSKLEEGIALDPAGLGLSSLSGVYANRNVKMLNVEDVAPNSTTVANGSYPLYTPIYLAVREDSPRNGDVAKFMEFLRTPKAQEVMRQHQVVPYETAVDLNNKLEERQAFINARLTQTPTIVATASTETPVGAPNAILESKMRIAPTAPSTEEARQRAERAKEKKTRKK